MSISREVLAKYVKPGCVFLETGSRWGTTLIRAADLGAAVVLGCETTEHCQSVAQIIISEVLYKLWVNGRACCGHVSSVNFLDRQYQHSVGPTVVFLDAHTESHSPVLEELEAISKWGILPKTILIDDMRCMADWKIEVGKIYTMLGEMGYKLSREHGVVEDDILVAQL